MENVTPGPSKKPRYYDTQVLVNSSSDTESDDEDEDLAEPFDPHTFYLNSSRKKINRNTRKVCMNAFHIMSVKLCQESHGHAVADPGVVPRVPGHHPRLQGRPQFQTDIWPDSQLGHPPSAKKVWSTMNLTTKTG